MSPKPVSLFCQVGFQPKKQGSTYFHRIEGDIPFGGTLELEDESEIRPYRVEDLLEGDLDFDRLPVVVREIIEAIAQSTYDAISSENPKVLRSLNFSRMVVTFRPYESEEEEKVTVH